MGTSSNKSKKNESDTKHAPFIPETCSDKIYNSIMRIEINAKKNIIGTGFFLKLHNNIFLITCYHVISNDLINSKNEIVLYYGKKEKEEKRIIKLDKNLRFIKSFENPIDISLIEITDEDNIPKNKFLLPDLNYKNGYEFYLNKFFYLAGYPNNGSLMYERCISSGKIIEIENYEFKHSLDARIGSSGSPICTRDGLNVIGIHSKGDKNEPINYGIFLGLIIDKLDIDIENEKEELFKKKNMQNENGDEKIDENKDYDSLIVNQFISSGILQEKKMKFILKIFMIFIKNMK